MASILKVGDKWRAQVRRTGHKSIAKSFDTKKAAEEWGRKVEREIDVDDYLDGRTAITLEVVINRYLEEMKHSANTKGMLNQISRGIGNLTLDQLTSDKIVSYVKSKTYGNVTAAMEVSALGTVLKVARVIWRMPIKPTVIEDARVSLRLMGRVGKSVKRDRRPTMDEIEKLCAYFDKRSALPMRDIIWFAIHTAMRLGEIEKLKWSDLNEADQTIMIRDRKDPRQKIGNNQLVPLLNAAMEIIKRQPRDEGERIFNITSNTVSCIFPRGCQALGIEDLRFHDLRHEGASRLFEMGMSAMEVCVFTGHKDLNMLKRYTHLRATDLVRKYGDTRPLGS